MRGTKETGGKTDVTNGQDDGTKKTESKLDDKKNKYLKGVDISKVDVKALYNIDISNKENLERAVSLMENFLTYTTSHFIEELRTNIKNLTNKDTIADQELSLLLGKESNFIRNIKGNINRNPNFKIKSTILESLESNIKKASNKRFDILLEPLNKYRGIYEPRAIDILTLIGNEKLLELSSIYGKDATIGIKYSDSFIEYIEDQRLDKETTEMLSNIIKYINTTGGIKNLIEFYAGASDSLSQIEIADKISICGFPIEKNTVQYYCKELFGKDVKGYKDRFPQFKLDEYQRENREHLIGIDAKNSCIRYFPTEARLIICEFIFNKLNNNIPIDLVVSDVINRLSCGKLFDSCLKKISETSFAQINDKLKDLNSSPIITEYFVNLAFLMNELHIFDKIFYSSNIKLSPTNFINDITQRKLDFKINPETLRGWLGDLIDHLIINTKFQTSRVIKERKIIFDDGEKKECSNCHEIKKYSDFRVYENRPYYYCRNCETEIVTIRRIIKKINLVLNLSNRNLKKLCGSEGCNIGISMLPTIEAHHKDPNIKISSIRDVKDIHIEKALDVLISENTDLLCVNHHRLKKKIYFIEFRDLIMRPDLFKKSADAIEDLIDDSIQNSQYFNKPTAKYQVKKLIRKRYILEHYYDGRCSVCKQVSTNDNLVALTLHHISFLTSNIDTRLSKLLHLKIPEIVKILEEIDCVCICANCHRMIHSPNLHKYSHSIFSEDLAYEIDEFYESARKRISQFIPDFSYSDVLYF